MEREQRLIEEINNKQFDYIIIVPRYTFDWGLPIIGKDYLINTMHYIHSNYQPYILYGDMPFKDVEKFGILVMRNKNK